MYPKLGTWKIYKSKTIDA